MRKVKIGLLFLVFLVLSGLANAQELMPLEEVDRLIESSPNKEVKAYFHSVERGTPIKRYDVVLRGVYRGSTREAIMFVTSHKIAGGMSGSPVYVGDKLVGALAFRVNTLPLFNWNWGGISPISLMIKESSFGQTISGASSFNYLGMKFEPIPLYKQNILVSQGRSSSIWQGSKIELKPGMPIVVDLAEWSDETGKSNTLSALGTITYIDTNGRIYAFGHPFLGAKNVIYSFRTAEVMGTSISELDSFKLVGKTSEVLGTITFDSTYGIYGETSLILLSGLNKFNLEFKSEGKTIHNFQIKISHSLLTPSLVQEVFSILGETYGAPLPQEASVTQIDSKVELEGYEPILWKELFASSTTRFGAQTLFFSSYRAAYESFFARVYGRLFQNDYDLKISEVSISVNFIAGQGRTFVLGAYKFPSKVIYGQDPEFEVIFVDRNGSADPIGKKISIEIDWDKVEKPVYNKDTLDTDKTAEKRVGGALGIYSSAWFFQIISQRGGTEKQKIIPDYFLGVDDFLRNFSSLLGATNQKIFLVVTLKSKSGLFDKKIAETKELIPQDIPGNGSSGWHVIEGGLKARVETVTDEGSVVFYPELPPIPDGYVIDRDLRDGLFFEVVLEN
ncbi:MAG: hypothetical protein A3B86_02405 [Candidatus Yanofskybacteria bacterium RIFCSPHIGHO2_02_FULL_38_22b]|uniref:Peptidase S55 domain-containing protein n=1 Tax=Candidatus Yanofskybacteria bacterium RIFCSPHIGHO2_02_FULL_38_22b TaxID=1802673 RepID=A0A1F8F5X8_9BACT|nr:MAG: hypothetical protein A3B86_02405 [Candidatus Yanofskybacteria bacterium RIFCSPHIGHO2_02_FULL_38_22b]OGN20298.1 MAG: hypothetical protein A2910_03240 [Candidatus Yanofskybacteria bacterium RIFCSPLOWO2_01_FULL_39_28]